MSETDQARLVDYLQNQNGNLYIESVNLGFDHHGTEMLESLGVKFVDDGVEDRVDIIAGVLDTLLTQVNLKYDGGDSPGFSIDRLAATDSEELYRSDDGNGRIFLNDPGESFKAISSSLVFSALRDGDSLSMKPYLMAEMVDYFLGITTVTDIREAFGQFAAMETLAFPNPASHSTTISFSLAETADVDIMFYDETGRLVNRINHSNMLSGDQQISWNLKDTSGSRVNNGIYFYSLMVDGQLMNSGKIMVRR